jgi:hypothetical protein
MPPTTDRGQQARDTFVRRLAWFAVLWVAGLVVTAAAAYGLRALLSM